MTMQNSDYVDEVLDRFIARHQGQYLDHSHAYGPQSPDVIEYYVEALLGRPWQFRAGFAARLWDDPQADMKDFVKIQRGEPLRKGDILVFDGATSGTVGIYTARGARVGSVQMLTQNPGPVHVIDIMRDGYVHRLLGAWRLSYAAECKILADKFAAQLHAAPQPAPVDRWIAEQVERTHATPPRDLQREINDHDLKRYGVPAPKVEGWGEFPKRRVVETVTPAEPADHWLKRLFLRRR